MRGSRHHSFLLQTLSGTSNRLLLLSRALLLLIAFAALLLRVGQFTCDVLLARLPFLTLSSTAFGIGTLLAIPLLLLPQPLGLLCLQIGHHVVMDSRNE